MALYWRARLGAGLVLAYLVASWLLYWLGAAVFLLPGYVNVDPFYNAPSQELMQTPELLDYVHALLTHTGFEEATRGIVAFGAGASLVILLAWIFRQLVRDPTPTTDQSQRSGAPLARRCILIGTIAQTLIASRLGNLLPSMTALIAAAWSLLPVGLALLAWEAWHSGRRRAFAGWLGAGLAVPLFTIGGLGYASYGVTMAMGLLALLATKVQPKWKVLVVALVLGYLAPSFYVTYMRDRDFIRHATGTARLDQMYRTFRRTEWFDPTNNEHLKWVVFRFNQSELIGGARYLFEIGAVDRVGGATLRDALLSWVPRILWPEKPAVAGSGDLVERYSGFEVDQVTSVGVGHVLELFINFGSDGVAAGMFTLGAFLAWLDVQAGRHLDRGNWRRFVLWYVPGSGFLQVGGSLSELVSGVVSSYFVVLLLSRMLAPRAAGQAERAADGLADDERTADPRRNAPSAALPAAR